MHFVARIRFISKENVYFSANATYLSPEIQNQLIALIGSAIRKEIIDRVKEAGAYSIIADETPDTSKKEQLSLVVRYVTKGVVEERLLAVMTVDETDAKTLLKTITEELQECGISISMLRGQCYDGVLMTGQVMFLASMRVCKLLCETFHQRHYTPTVMHMSSI